MSMEDDVVFGRFMPQHYTRATVEVSVWCQVCRKETMHRVDDRRRGRGSDERYSSPVGMGGRL